MIKHKLIYLVAGLIIVVAAASVYLLTRTGPKDDAVDSSLGSGPLDAAAQYAEEQESIFKYKAEDSSLSEEERAKYSVAYISSLIYNNKLDEAVREAESLERAVSEEALVKSNYYDTASYLYKQVGDDEKAAFYSDKFLESVEKEGRADELSQPDNQ